MRDITLMFLSVPLAFVGGLVALWLSLEINETPDSILVAIAFLGAAVTMWVGGTVVLAVAVYELFHSG